MLLENKMSRMYYVNYKLLKDTPDHKQGWPIKWDGTRRKYFFNKVSTWSNDAGKPDYCLDYNGQSFTIDEIESKTEWFEPTGASRQFIPEFPSRTKLSEFVNLNFENRLVDDVDEARALSDVWVDKQFNDNLYNFVKSEYNRVHKLDSDVGNEHE